MDGRILRLLEMTALSVAVAVIIPTVTWSLWDDDRTAEYVCLGSIALGMCSGLVLFIVLSRRSSFGRICSGRSDRMRIISSIISFLVATSTALATAVSAMHADYDVSDFAIISAAMIIVSMIIQAFFWKSVSLAGYMSTSSAFFLFLALILMNCSAILALDNGGIAMMAVSIIPSIAAVLMMYDWEWSTDITFILTVVSAIVTILIVVVDDYMQFGTILVFVVPAILIFIGRNKLKASFLVSDGERLL